MKNLLNTPQVVAALISSVVALLVALIPILTNNSNQPVPTPTPTIVVEVEVKSSTETAIQDVPPTVTESSEVVATATSVPPTATSIPPTDPPPANVLLLYDDASFTIYNQGSQQLSIGSLRFQSDSGNWDASRWGNSLTDNFATTNCLRLRDSNSGQRQPPAICGTLLGLQLVAGNTLFWLNTDTFDVMVDGSVIATCSTTEESCGIFVP